MEAYNEKIYFHLPGMFEQIIIYAPLLELYHRKRELFKDNVEIGSVYGAPGCIWNGGRFLFSSLMLDRESLRKYRNNMNYYKIPIRFTFTNCLLEEKHLYDTYCNLLLEEFANGNNEIICNSELLETYIRNKYADRYRYISSTTKRLNNKEEQNKELDKDYYLVVIDYDHNKDFDYLQTLDVSKVELLCNPVCQSNCPRRIEHYKNISECQLNFSPDKLFYCPHAGKTLEEAKQGKNFITPEEINSCYIPMGFRHFKLEGRVSPEDDVINILMYYLIKDDKVEEVKHFLIEEMKQGLH